MIDWFPQSYKKTIGVDFLEKQLRVHGEDVRLMLWDTAGQEEFDAITKAYYRGAQAGVHILQKMHEIYWRFEKKEL